MNIIYIIEGIIMAFIVKQFPNQRFETHKELKEAILKRDVIEKNLVTRSGETKEITRVIATIVSAPQDLITKKFVELEIKVDSLHEIISSLKDDKISLKNKENILLGTVLRGESKGIRFSLEVIDEGYLCSNGQIYPSLSAAALGVSGNRRSGWKFWKNTDGRSIGNIVGRFKTHAGNSPFTSG